MTHGHGLALKDLQLSLRHTLATWIDGCPQKLAYWIYWNNLKYTETCHGASTEVYTSVDFCGWHEYFGQWREATFPWWGSRLKSCAPLNRVAEIPHPHNTLQLIHHKSQHTRLGSQRLTGSWPLMMQKESATVQYQWLSDYSISDGFWCRILFILFGISHSFWFQVAWAGTARIRWFWVSG